MWLSCNKISLQATVSSKEFPLTDSSQPSKAEREKGTEFLPKYDANGLVTGIVIDATTKDVLMVAFMNEEAIAKTRATEIAHFWSRSRQSLWMKGETSGNVMRVREILVDCDQDALLIYVEPAGPACHTGENSCFYRRLSLSGRNEEALVKVNA